MVAPWTILLYLVVIIGLVPCAGSAVFSQFLEEFWVPNITFYVLFSLRISDKTSLTLGNGLILTTLPRTSSKFLLRPSKNL